MNKSKKNYLKGNKGITLIALVVTIIILIILAGISINLVLGENGLIQKAKQSKVAQTEAEAKEKVEMLLAEYAMEREFNNKTLLTFLQEKKTNNQIDEVTDNEDGTYTIEVDGYAVTINVQKLSITEVGKAGLRPIVSNIKITTDGTAEVTDKVIVGTPLTINFEHSINGGTTTVDKTLPYTTNGTETEVIFVITGIVNGENYTRTIIVSLIDKYKIPQITIGEIKITNADGEEVVDKGVAVGTPLKINFDNSIEEGTTVVKLGEETVTLPYTTNGTDTEFNFVVVGTVNGIDYQKDVKVSIANKYRDPAIADMVQIGDFVNYSLGNWTEEDIEKVGTYYGGTGQPGDCKFGGFGTSTSKDNSTSVPDRDNRKCQYSGWRVLSKNDNGTINIVHAGIPEMYKNATYQSSNSVNIFKTLRDWSMYEDCSTNSVNTNYAVEGSAHCMTYEEANDITGKIDSTTNTLRNMSTAYFLAKLKDSDSIYSVNHNGVINGAGNIRYGIRPVVTLKETVKVTANEGDTTHDTLETAWNLSM